MMSNAPVHSVILSSSVVIIAMKKNLSAPERQYHKGMTLTMTSFNMINTVEPPIKRHIYQFKGLLLLGPNCTTVFIHLAAQTSQVVYRLPKVDHSSLS